MKKKRDARQPASFKAAVAAARLAGSSWATNERAIARVPYTARAGTSEVSVSKGDRLEIFQRHTRDGWKGWSTIKNHETGKRGLIPTSYVASS